MTDIAGRRIIVTGASTGIGEAIVRDLTASGAQIAGLARRTEPLARLARDTGLHPVPADLRDPAAVTAAIDAAAEILGGLDALVNNAGTFRLGRIADGQFTDWQDMVQVNVLGLAAATKAAIPHLTASTNGQIINISSMSGRRVPGSAAGVYAGTKHAVHAISDALRDELHGQGIRVTVLAPGYVRTNYGDYITDPEIRQRAADGQREQGLDPAHVAAQVNYILASPKDVHLIEIALTSIRQPPG
jgi:NADP-dependent 3-hydroxy acid dehydrogenase YdfG